MSQQEEASKPPPMERYRAYTTSFIFSIENGMIAAAVPRGESQFSRLVGQAFTRFVGRPIVPELMTGSVTGTQLVTGKPQTFGELAALLAKQLQPYCLRIEVRDGLFIRIHDHDIERIDPVDAFDEPLSNALTETPSSEFALPIPVAPSSRKPSVRTRMVSVVEAMGDGDEGPTSQGDDREMSGEGQSIPVIKRPDS